MDKNTELDFYGDPFLFPEPLDVQAYLDGDKQGRDQGVSYGVDHKPVREYLSTWSLPEGDYWEHRQALDGLQYAYFGNCPRCEAEGAIHLLPYPHARDNWMVCSAGCKVRWWVGCGLFSARIEDELTQEQEHELLERFFEREEVEPLTGYKPEIAALLDKSDIAIRIMPLLRVTDCALCGLGALPEDLRKLAHFVHGVRSGKETVPVVSLNAHAPLCMICADEVAHILQQAVNGMWWLAADHLGLRTISTPHYNLVDDEKGA